MEHENGIAITLLNGTRTGPWQVALPDWDCQMYRLSRLDLIRTRAAMLHRPGICFLFGRDHHSDFVCMDQSTDICTRALQLGIPGTAGPVWTDAVFLIPETELLSGENPRYLMARFLQLGRQSGRYQILSGEVPSIPELSQPAAESLEAFLRSACTAVHALHCPLFDSRPSGGKSPDPSIFSLRGEDDAYEATARLERNGIRLLQGSRLAPEPELPEIRPLRQACAGCVEEQILKRDVLFPDPFCAASFVSGTSANGLAVWKTPDDASLGKVLGIPQEGEDPTPVFPPPPKPIPDLLILNSRLSHARALWNPDGFTVLRGSYLYYGIGPDCPKEARMLRRHLEKTKVLRSRVVLQNLRFADPSAAAAFLLGTAVDGPSLWRNQAGISLAELLKQSDSLFYLDVGTEKATCRIIPDGYLLLRGSSLSKMSASCAATTRRERERQKERGAIQDTLTTEDLPFPSASALTAFVLGRTAPALDSWSTDTGVPMRLALNPLPPAPHPEDRPDGTPVLRLNDYDFVAFGYPDGEKFTILKGSQFNSQVSLSCSLTVRALRKELQTNGTVRNQEFTTDFTCSSPNTAVACVLGRTRTDRPMWVSRDGIPLRLLTIPAAQAKIDSPEPAQTASAKPAQAPEAASPKPVQTPEPVSPKSAQAPKAAPAKPAQAPEAASAKPAQAPKAASPKPVQAPEPASAKPAQAPEPVSPKPAQAPEAASPKPAQVPESVSPQPPAASPVASKAAAASSPDDDLLFLVGQSCAATGRLTENGFEVLSGSQFSAVESPRCPASIRKHRQFLRDSGSVISTTFVRDTLFPSPSAAASCICGFSRRGPISWKDRNGVLLRDKKPAFEQLQLLPDTAASSGQSKAPAGEPATSATPAQPKPAASTSKPATPAAPEPAAPAKPAASPRPATRRPAASAAPNPAAPAKPGTSTAPARPAASASPGSATSTRSSASQRSAAQARSAAPASPKSAARTGTDPGTASTEVLSLVDSQAVALGKIVPEGFVVLMGSKMREKETIACAAHIRARRREEKENGSVRNNCLTRDLLFDTPSAAASFLLGRSANGLVAWVNAQGVSLKQLQDPSQASPNPRPRFGSGSTTPGSRSRFGSAPAAPTTPEPRSRFSSDPAAPTTPEPRSRFGSAPAAPTTPEPRSRFGSAPAAPTTPGPRSRSGSTPATPTTPDSRSRFGSTPAAPTTPDSRSRFGSAPAAPTTPDSRSRFGSAPTTPGPRSRSGSIPATPTTPDSRSRFGSAPAAPTTSGSKSRFGSTPEAPTSPDSRSRFGSAPAAPAAPTTPGSRSRFGSTSTAPTAPTASRDPDLLHLNGNRISAHGRRTSRGFLVLRGSMMASAETVSCPQNARNLRQSLQASGKVKNFTFCEDVLFATSTTAANCLLGTSVSGLWVWENDDGVLLKDLSLRSR